MRSSAKKTALALALTVAVLGGCTHVHPYERGRLAHPSMSGNPMSSSGEAHMYAVHEGATGGSDAAEGGCGCN